MIKPKLQIDEVGVESQIGQVLGAGNTDILIAEEALGGTDTIIWVKDSLTEVAYRLRLPFYIKDPMDHQYPGYRTMHADLIPGPDVPDHHTAVLNALHELLGDTYELVADSSEGHM